MLKLSRNKRSIAILTVMLMVLSLMPAMAFAAIPSGTLITNGDFELGAQDFYTEYELITETGWSTLQPPYKYAIGTDPYLYHSAWGPGFKDHTSGDGKMMIVNGTSELDRNAIVWSQIVMLPECTPESFPLFAGQDMLIGNVLVKFDEGEGNICVKFELNNDAIVAGWLINEAHVAVGDDATKIPNKNGNPIPGQFPINETIEPGVTETGWYCLPASGSAPYAIAAHAVVKKTDSVVNAVAPYGPSEVTDTIQGLRYDYTAVKAIRSNPLAALVFEGTKLESDFYSLGFGPGDEIDDAYLVVRFNTPILNGFGPDLQIVEDTWGLPYPVESCDVFASEDGLDWTFLGEANNQTPLPDGVHTFTNFDFDLGSLASASFIKVQDTSIRSDFASLASSQGATLDGFDVNAILSLQTNRTCTTYSETAWGGTSDFSGKNWATYIDYTPSVCSDSYQFSFYAASSYPTAPAQLQVKINDMLLPFNNNDIEPFTLNLTSTLGSWQEYRAVWNANGATSAKIEIRDLRYTYTGDDFCIDDISFVKLP